MLTSITTTFYLLMSTFKIQSLNNFQICNTVLLTIVFQCHIFLPFHTLHGVLKARILKWFAIPFSSGPRFVRILHHDPSILGGHIHSMAHSFIELDKAVVHVGLPWWLRVISSISFL